MPVPQFHLSISGSVLAAYGAVLSTITAAVQVVSHYKDRAHLKIRVQPNMETMGDRLYDGKTLVIMYVSNAGRRPVTIAGVGAFRLFPNKPFVIVDTRPVCPVEITEGKQLTAFMDQSQLDLSAMESWEAYTATGQTFRFAVVPWYRRWWNRRKFRSQAIKDGKEKTVASAATREGV